jgi:iron(III) transport system ATP-binding protein
MTRGERAWQVAEALARVGLETYAGAYPHMLSGGQQQRVALARALAPRPQVVLLDEAFASLDARLREQVRDDTLHVLQTAGIATLLVTHDAEEAMRMADRIALLKDGRLVQAGRAEDLYLNPASLFVAGFFSELNLFEGRVKGGAVETSLGRVDAAGFSEGDDLTVAVRMTGFDVSETTGDTQARILSRRYLGVVELLELAVPGAETPVRARVRCGALSARAKDIWLSTRKSDVLLFETQRENA